ncbi:MAG: protoporphyrinogen oxidase, partial [Acidimicrobiales bacterium]
PQYQVGHPGRVERIEAALRAVPRLVLAGAALRGVGIPACIAQAQRAAEAMLAALGPSQP